MVLETLLQPFDNVLAFTFLTVLFAGLPGYIVRSFAIGGFGSWLAFVYITVNLDIPFLGDILYVLMGIILIALSFKIAQLWVQNSQESGDIE